MTTRVTSPERQAGLDGHLRLVCDVDEAGRSYLSEQSFRVPFHLSKPFRDNGVLVVNIVNPTAGLFRGDTTQCQVRVETGARLLLTNPSATRVHDTQGGRSGATQDYLVRNGGWLEILPELFIPQRGARHRQRTRIVVEPGGELVFLEMLAPGRVASGEILEFEELDWLTEIRYGDQGVARERFILSQNNKSLRGLKMFSPHAYFATFFLITSGLNRDSSCWNEIDALQAPGVWIGSSALIAGGRVVKILAQDSVELRRVIAQVRHSCYCSAGWPQVETRKL
jgi:urease accessory protein